MTFVDLPPDRLLSPDQRDAFSIRCRDPGNMSYFADTPQEQPLYRDIMALTDHYIDRVDLRCNRFSWLRSNDIHTHFGTAIKQFNYPWNQRG